MSSALRRPSEQQSALRDVLLDVIPFPIYVVDGSSLQIVGLNAAMRRATGAELGEACHWAIYRQASPCTFCRLAELAQEPPGVTKVFEHFNDRDECWYQIHETMVQWSDDRTVKHSVAVDISGLKGAQNELSEAYALLALKSIELENASVTDALTELFNRRRLDQVFDQEMERAGRYGHALSLILTDVDRFKVVNDSHGHQIGDQVLQQISAILRHAVRSVDVVGRWGGEEFLIICPETTLDGAFAVAEKLRSAVAEAAWPLGLSITNSFGVGQFRPGDSMKDVVARADAAMYRAKTLGRNRVER